MAITISLEKRHIFGALGFFAILLGIAFVAAAVPNPGHSPSAIDWNEQITQNVKATGKVIVHSTPEPDNMIELGHGGANGYINVIGDGELHVRHEGLTLARIDDTGKLTLSGDLHINGDLFGFSDELTIEVGSCRNGPYYDDPFDACQIRVCDALGCSSWSSREFIMVRPGF